MLLPPTKLKQYFGVSPDGVLHVGAHKAEELAGYRKARFGRVIWVEAQPELVDELRKTVEAEGDLVVQACVWSVSGLKRSLKITNNGESSSLYSLGTHETHHPEIEVIREVEMTTSTLFEAVPLEANFEFMNIDIQGAELEALKGLGKRLDSVLWIYLEVNREQLYRGIPQIEEITSWLRERGYVLALSLWTPYNWGDALFVRASPLKLATRMRMAIGAVRALVWFRAFPARKMLKLIRKQAQGVFSARRKFVA